MSNEGDIISCTGKVLSILSKNLKLLLVQKFAAQVYMRMFNCAYLKVKKLKLTMQGCMHRKNVRMFESHIHKN